MSHLIEQEIWEEGVYQIEKTDRVVGGPDGISNIQAKQLANRTQYLKKHIAKVATDMKPYLVQVGSIVLWMGELPPEGWLELNGQSFNKQENPELARLFPTGVLPDYRGRFPRGWAHGSSVDPDSARLLGSTQEDAMQRITGGFPVANRWRGTFSGVFKAGVTWNTNYKNGGGDDWGKQVSFDSALMTRIAEETRPRNIAVMFIIKTDLANAIEGAAGPSNLIIAPGSITEKVGVQIQLKSTLLPESMASQYPVSYRSTDDAVCTVTNAGLVKLVSAGTASIVASLSSGLVSTIPVISHRYLTSLSLAAIPSLSVGDEYQSVVTFAPSNHTEPLVYSSSDTSVAVFSNDGLVMAVAAGSCVLTVEGSLSGLKSTHTLTVNAVVEVIPFLQIDNVLSEIKEKGITAQKAARGNIGISESANEIMLEADPTNALSKGSLVEIIQALATRITQLEGR
ncbi:Ig-like domain-containing protein [Providencia huashanensis]|uniref:Ig-like domain-containing protein n=1 Tax=Providencia huashanensis TaxID=3037798 RepID=UPI002AFE7F4C|nr:Ig-like domain-containing protein [Providencia sp. 23021821]